MTREELSQYRKLCQEIKQSQERKKKLLKLRRAYGEGAYTVKMSLPYFPYTEHSIPLDGTLEEECLKETQREKARLQRLTEKRDAVVTFIDGIDESELRQIFTLRYLEGMSWEQVSKKLGNKGDGSTERKKHDRYLKVSRNSRN